MRVGAVAPLLVSALVLSAPAAAGGKAGERPNGEALWEAFPLEPAPRATSTAGSLEPDPAAAGSLPGSSLGVLGSPQTAPPPGPAPLDARDEPAAAVGAEPTTSFAGLGAPQFVPGSTPETVKSLEAPLPPPRQPESAPAPEPARASGAERVAAPVAASGSDESPLRILLVVILALSGLVAIVAAAPARALAGVSPTLAQQRPVAIAFGAICLFLLVVTGVVVGWSP